jgi:HlyD family secretion protein
MDRPVNRKRAMPRRYLLAAAVLVPLALGLTLWRPVTRWFSAERTIDAKRLRTADVVRGDLERDVAVQGRVVAAFHPTLFSPARGIVRLQVRAGDTVEQGRVLAIVDSPELQSRLKQEQASLESAMGELERVKIDSQRTELSDRQQVDLASVTLEAGQRARARAERSKQEGIINDVDYETAQDVLRRAEIELQHAKENATFQHDTREFELRNREHAVERQRLFVADLQRQVDDLSVRAPVAGLVSRLDVEDHAAVEQGIALVTVVDLSAFEVEVGIPESYADEIGPGTPAVVTYDGKDWPAVVKVVAPEVQQSEVRGIVAFASGEPAGLRQSQRLSTRVILESRKDVLKVARGPFVETGGGREAWVVRGEIAERIPIEVGATSVTEVEIVSGLAQGDEIVVSDTAAFADARRVWLRR